MDFQVDINLESWLKSSGTSLDSLESAERRSSATELAEREREAKDEESGFVIDLCLSVCAGPLPGRARAHAMWRRSDKAAGQRD